MPITRDGEEYYTAMEAAKYLGIARDTFYRVVRGQLQAYQLGVLKRTYYRKTDLERLQEIRPLEKRGGGEEE